MKSTSKRAITLCLAAALTGLAAAAAAATKPWDQASVTSIAVELEQAFAGIDEAMESQPPQPTALQQRSHNAVMHYLRLIVNSSRQLAGELQAGQGYTQTVGTYFQIQAFLSSARQHAPNSWIAEATREKIEVARKALTRLEPYYEDV